MTIELSTNEQIQAAATAALTKLRQESGYGSWVSALSKHITTVQKATQEEFLSPTFQQNLWESEAVSATGMGRVDVSSAIHSKQIAVMLWDFRNLTLSVDPIERGEQIKSSWKKFESAIDPLVNRWPRLKMYRIFAAIFPQDFTTVAHTNKLRKLAQAMGITELTAKHPIALHSEVLRKLESALGEVRSPPALEGVERMSLPWLFYADYIQEQGDAATIIDDPATGSESLNPLPAARRRKGLLAIAGYLTSIRSMIEFAKDGCTREDMREHIRSVNPKLAEKSINTNVNALIAEWGVIKAEGNHLTLTLRGESLLETGEAAEVSDWLLTRILGFDHVLFQLQKEQCFAETLRLRLQSVNPGWTTRFVPDILLNWIINLGLAETNDKGLLQLTREGTIWASRIHWSPEDLPKPSVDGPLESVEPENTHSNPVLVSRPSLDLIYAAFDKTALFPRQLIARLDAGLWHNERRHFAVLTGLSGAGKTLLARSYGLSLWAQYKKPEEGLYILPVQPGWHEPSSILGYVSPLLENTYVRTGFLDFFLKAAGDPSRPYTVVLDEMNLSHPEQYLAPLLSAMETGDAVEFHTSDEELTGVPPNIPYPPNLVIIGTVNMDETTHGLSDKVLDRACIIDFWKVDVDAYPGWNTSDLSAETKKTVKQVLQKLGNALEPVRLHFGWRTVADVIGFVRSATEAGMIGETQALDHAIYGKILTKLRGEDTQRLRSALTSALEILQSAELQESASKVSELLMDLKQTGNARFWR